MTIKEMENYLVNRDYDLDEIKEDYEYNREDDKTLTYKQHLTYLVEDYKQMEKFGLC